MTASLEGRTALVTGASRGIGLATANALAAARARVVLTARNAGALREAAASLGSLASFEVCDLADADAVQHLAERVERQLGAAPDILVNNAGAFAIAPVEATEPSTFARTVATNLVAPFLLVRAFLPAMRARGTGHIVTVGSLADREILPGNSAYAASKHGARALHEVLRAELRGSGLRATLVSPARVDTPLWDPIEPDGREALTPRARMLAPDAVADAIVYAVSRTPEINIDELRLSRS